MILVLHILIALGSLLTATALVFQPTRLKLNLSIGLAVATLVSGVLLVVVDASHLMAACRSGLVYLAVVSVLLYVGSRKLVRVEGR
jgi:hypothetical protein